MPSYCILSHDQTSLANLSCVGEFDLLFDFFIISHYFLKIYLYVYTFIIVTLCILIYNILLIQCSLRIIYR